MTRQVGTIVSEKLSDFEYRFIWTFRFDDVFNFPEYDPEEDDDFYEYSSPSFRAMQHLGDFYFKISVTRMAFDLDKNKYQIHWDFELIKEGYMQKSIVLDFESEFISPYYDATSRDEKYCLTFSEKSIACHSGWSNDESIMCAENVPTFSLKIKFQQTKIPDSVSIPDFSSLPCDLTQDLKQLYNTKILSNVTIKVGDSSFDVHKSILSARSSVFHRMLESNFTESKSNSITITDFSAEVFDKFLKYLYSNELDVENMNSVLLLYSLSDKYDVQGLRIKCSKIIELKIDSTQDVNDINLVCKVLKLACHHNDQNIKTKSLNFISNHFSQVGENEEWKNILKNDVQLASEVLTRVAAALKSKTAKVKNIGQVVEAASTKAPVSHPRFNVGDKVQILADVETLKIMQVGHGGWVPMMAKLIGKVATVYHVTDKQDIMVQYEGSRDLWTFNPGALKKIQLFSVGDLVRIMDDLGKMKDLHGEWTEKMKTALGKTGKIVKIYSTGNLRVNVDGQILTFNPLCVSLSTRNCYRN